MTTDITIYHNPRCSKSRATLKLLHEQGHEPCIIEYLNTPPDEQQLIKVLKLLGMQPRDLMRTKEKEYREAGLDDPALTDSELIKGMVEHPRLIERPIVIANGKAALGRPPESVLKIIT